MEAKFLVNPSLNTANPHVTVDNIRTDMLMLTAMRGLGLGPGPQALDKRVNGKLSEKIKQKKFKGDLSENLLLELDGEHPARSVLLIGLGRPSTFNYCGLREALTVAVKRAVSMDCKRITLEIPKDRLTAGTMNLRGMAHAIKELVIEALDERACGHVAPLVLHLSSTDSDLNLSNAKAYVWL